MTTKSVDSGNVPTRLAGWCECGCGTAVALKRRYILGHQARKSVRYVEAPGPLETPCWIWQLAVLQNGYGLERRGKKMVYAHRASYEDVHGQIPNGLWIDHLCRVRVCVNPDHLEPVTAAENSRRGASAKVNAAQVADIRDSSEGQQVLSERYGISQSQVSRIRNGRSWA